MKRLLLLVVIMAIAAGITCCAQKPESNWEERWANLWQEMIQSQEPQEFTDPIEAARAGLRKN